MATMLEMAEEDVGRDLPALPRARALIESEVNAAIDARVVDIVGQLLERRIAEQQPGHAGCDRSKRACHGPKSDSATSRAA